MGEMGWACPVEQTDSEWMDWLLAFPPFAYNTTSDARRQLSVPYFPGVSLGGSNSPGAPNHVCISSQKVASTTQKLCRRNRGAGLRHMHADAPTGGKKKNRCRRCIASHFPGGVFVDEPFFLGCSCRGVCVCDVRWRSLKRRGGVALSGGAVGDEVEGGGAASAAEHAAHAGRHHRPVGHHRRRREGGAKAASGARPQKARHRRAHRP